MQAKNILDVWLRNIELKPIPNQPQEAAVFAPYTDSRGKQRVSAILSETDTCDLQRNFSPCLPTHPLLPIHKSKSMGRHYAFPLILVEATGFEPTTSWSRTKRATICATPRYRRPANAGLAIICPLYGL